MAKKGKKNSASRKKYWDTNKKAKNKVRRLSTIVLHNPNDLQAAENLRRWENKLA